MSSFMLHGIIITFVICFFVANAEEREKVARNDIINVTSVEWQNNTVGTIFYIQYKSTEKPLIVWGRDDYMAHYTTFPGLVPIARSTENWINTFRNQNGLLILHVPHSFRPKSLHVSFVVDGFSLTVVINRMWCEKQGSSGKQSAPPFVCTIHPFTDSNQELKNVIIKMESEGFFRDVSASYLTVNDGNEISSTEVDINEVGSIEKGDIYENIIKLNEVPLNSILFIRYRTSTFRPLGVISLYQYQHSIVIRKEESPDNIASVLTNVDTELKVQLTTTGFVKCVAFGFPRPSIHFLRGQKRIEPNHNYDVTFSNVIVSYLEIPNFSLADSGVYRCVAESGSAWNSGSYLDYKVSHWPHVSKAETRIITLTKEKVEIVCVAEGDAELEVSFTIRFPPYPRKPAINIYNNENTTMDIGNVISYEFTSETATFSNRKSAHLVILTPDLQELKTIYCAAGDSRGNGGLEVLHLRGLEELYANWIVTLQSSIKRAHCRGKIQGDPYEDMPDRITIEWYKNEIKPENKIQPDYNTVIVNQNNNKYDNPESFLLFLDKRSPDHLDFTVICRAFTRFKEYSVVLDE